MKKNAYHVYYRSNASGHYIYLAKQPVECRQRGADRVERSSGEMHRRGRGAGGIRSPRAGWMQSLFTAKVKEANGERHGRIKRIGELSRR
jgi:hypothetical protein